MHILSPNLFCSLMFYNTRDLRTARSEGHALLHPSLLKSAQTSLLLPQQTKRETQTTGTRFSLELQTSAQCTTVLENPYQHAFLARNKENTLPGIQKVATADFKQRILKNCEISFAHKVCRTSKGPLCT